VCIPRFGPEPSRHPGSPLLLNYCHPDRIQSKNDSLTFADLAGKLTVLRVVCPKCNSEWNYPVHGLIRKYGREAKLIYWLDTITADCPNRNGADKSNQCALELPGVSDVF
jgi:hypothetical protein